MFIHWGLDEVERPFFEQLTAIGWCYVAGDLYQPAKTGRASFVEAVQEGTLRRQLYALNLRDVAGVAQPSNESSNGRRISLAVVAHIHGTVRHSDAVRTPL